MAEGEISLSPAGYGALVVRSLGKERTWWTGEGHETLMEVIGDALSTIIASDAEGYFEHCGYRKVVQSL